MSDDDARPVIAYRSAPPVRPAGERHLAFLIGGSAVAVVGLALLVPILLVTAMMVTRPHEDESSGALLLMCCGVPGLLGLGCIFVGVRSIVIGVRSGRR